MDPQRSATRGKALRDDHRWPHHVGVHQPSAAAVRLLAAWQQQRRELTDRLDGLLLHGPTAVDRVAARGDELRAALESERDAFEAFVDLVRQPGRGTAPAAPQPAYPDARSYPPLRSVPSDAAR